MSLQLQPTGLRLVAPVGNSPYAGGSTEYPLTTDNANAMAIGDPCALVAGSVAPVAASPVSGTLSANTPLGVVLGFRYEDPINPTRAFVTSQILPANAISAHGYKNIFVLVADDPNARFVVQADGTIPASDLGATIALKNFNAADLTARTSRVEADSASVSAASNSTLALKIVGFDRTLDNAAGDAFTKLIVKWNAAVHYYSVAGAH